jgi:phage shock protein E
LVTKVNTRLTTVFHYQFSRNIAAVHRLKAIRPFKSMIKKIRNFLRVSPPNYKGLIKIGATILDVRSKEEFALAHIPGSTNIPIQLLPESISELNNKNSPVITCGASVRRSEAAKKILTSKGFISVYNGGLWTTLQANIK